MAENKQFGISEQLDCSDCVNHGGDWECDHVLCRKGKDTISRQWLMECVEEGWIKFDTQEDENRFVHLIRDIAPPAQPGWIPVTERMPGERDAGVLKKLGTDKRSDYVLATVEVKGERMTVTACTYDGKWDWRMKYAFPEYKVIAWTPLPEPWKGGQE